ncbi:MAG: PadR family transcriptional regulator [Isosphaeraceae bacterium]
MDSLLQGSTLEMLVLEVIAQGPSYGYEIAQTVAGRSNGTFEMKEGSLYPALHRLERQKLLRAFWREADGRRRKYYELTDLGKKELVTRKQSWLRFAAGINGVLGTHQPGWAEG